MWTLAWPWMLLALPLIGTLDSERTQVVMETLLQRLVATGSSIAVIDITGSKSSIAFRPLPQDDPRQRRPDISKAERLLDWRPTIQLKEGLTRTAAYFETLIRDSKHTRSA